MSKNKRVSLLILDTPCLNTKSGFCAPSYSPYKSLADIYNRLYKLTGPCSRTFVLLKYVWLGNFMFGHAVPKHKVGILQLPIVPCNKKIVATY